MYIDGGLVCYQLQTNQTNLKLVDWVTKVVYKKMPFNLGKWRNCNVAKNFIMGKLKRKHSLCFTSKLLGICSLLKYLYNIHI